VVKQLERPWIFLYLQMITDVSDFASQLLKGYRISPKHLIENISYTLAARQVASMPQEALS